MTTKLNKKELTALSKKKADHAVNFIECLRHVKDPWHGVFFELLPWQKELVRDFYGTLRPDGTRQYRTAYVEIPKKQGKSEIAAAVALYHLCADGEHHAEVYGCAADRAQASLVFDVAADMVDQEPALKKLIKPVLSQKRLIYKPTSSYYQVLSAEAFTKHGLNPSCVIFDELHAQPNRALWDVMTFGAGDARTQPVWWAITTAGDDPERVTIGWEVHKKAEEVLLGIREDKTLYPVIFGIDPDENRVWTGRKFFLLPDGTDWSEAWKDKEIAAAVNPSIGQTVGEDRIEDAVASVEGDEAQERLFRQLRLNEWVKYKAGKYISVHKWDASAGLVIPEKLRGKACYGGLDLSSSIDTTAFALLFPPDEDCDRWRAFWRLWIPEDNLKERVYRDKVPYDKWNAAGYLTTTPGDVIDYAFIEAEILRLAKDYEILEIGYDPWHALQTSIKLDDAGMTMVEVRQGAKTLGPALKFMREQIHMLNFEHGGNPVIRWMLNNMDVKIDENENARPMKGKKTGRIDGITALLNAFDRAIRHLEIGSVYDGQDLKII